MYLFAMFWPVKIMDLSSVQSGSKCSSDFSIERILSEDTRIEEAPLPSWLCCTRYQPPRISRPSSVVSRARRSGRHPRVPFTASQAAALEAAYARAPYLAPPALRALAAALMLREDRIKIWFQNRRARERREKSSNIAPPQAITLPPTNMNMMQGPHSNAWLQQQNTFAIPQQNTLPTDIHESNQMEGYQVSHVKAVTSRFSPEPSQSHKNMSFVRMCEIMKPTKSADLFSEESNEDRPETPLNIET